MDKFIYWFKRNLTIHFEIYGNMPFARIGWVWAIFIFFFGYYYFGVTLAIIIGVIMVVNFINGMRR